MRDLVKRPVPTLIHNGQAWVRAEHYDAERAEAEGLRALIAESGDESLIERAIGITFRAAQAAAKTPSGQSAQERA